MDPITTALCALGAALLVAGRAERLDGGGGAFLLGAGLYGVYRASGRGRWLVAAPAALWVVAHTWALAPERVTGYPFPTNHATLYAAPGWIADFALLIVLASSVVAARDKVGLGLAGITAATLGVAALASIAALVPSKGTPSDAVLGVTTAGWRGAGLGLTALTWLALGIGARTPAPSPPEASPPREAAVLAGGAVLLAAVIEAAPGMNDSTVRAWCVAALTLAWIVIAVGLALAARKGAGPVTWGATGIVGFQVLIGVPLALALADRFGSEADASSLVGVAAPFGLLALAMATLSSRTAPFAPLRSVTSVALFIAVYGAGQALLRGIGVAFGALNERHWFASVDLVLRPAAAVGLLLLAAMGAFIAAPPETPA